MVYVVLGSFAIRRGSTRGTQLACYLGALAVFAFILGIARAHHPAGIFWLLGAA